MVENILFVVQMAVIAVGLILTVAALIQIKRQGGFDKAMALTSEGKWTLGRHLFFGALASLVLALLIGFFGRYRPTRQGEFNQETLSDPAVVMSNSLSGWNYDSDEPIPGVHNGYVRVLTFTSKFSEDTVLLWCDRQMIEWHGNTRKNGAINEGHFKWEEGGQVDFRFEAVDGTLSKVSIDGETYDASNGLLFLISTQSENMQVKQLDATVRGFPPKNPANSEDSSLNNPDIVKFFTNKKSVSD